MINESSFVISLQAAAAGAAEQHTVTQAAVDWKPKNKNVYRLTLSVPCLNMDSFEPAHTTRQSLMDMVT